jgi:hypothetical protein
MAPVLVIVFGVMGNGMPSVSAAASAEPRTSSWLTNGSSAIDRRGPYDGNEKP